MKKIKIGIFLDSYFPNVDGVVMVVDNLAKNLSKIADVTVVVPKTNTIDEDKNRPYKVIRIDSINVPTTEYKLAVTKIKRLSINRKLKKEHFDIIHIHSPFSIGRLGIALARKEHIPVVATMHTRFDFEFKKYLKFNLLSKIAIKNIIRPYNKCDECIAVNHALVNVYKKFGYKYEPVVIYNGTDMKTVESPNKAIKVINKKYNISKDELVFLFVGRIISIKNIFFILEVLKKLKEKNYKFKMFYVGIGPDIDELKKKIKEYEMDDYVIVTGKITDRELLKSIYFRADLFLFASLFDASSLVQIEAASQYTPTMFIEGSVTSDTVTNNVNGFTAPNDIDLFTERLIEIINDKDKLKEIGINAHRDLALSWKEISKRTYEEYIKLINKNAQ